MFQFQQNNLLLIIIGLVLAGFLLFLMGIAFQKIISRRKKQALLRVSRKDGLKGENRAKVYLLKQGFEIVKEQAYLEQQLFVDGHPQTFQLRADFIVSKNGKLSVVDAKSGDHGVDPTCSATRRQLLEYFIYFKVDDAYIYNSIENKLHLVTFLTDPINRRIRMHFGYWLLLFIIVELVCVILLLYFHVKLPFLSGTGMLSLYFNN
jgi:hypothetical protein